MGRDIKRFTIYIPRDLSRRLAAVHREAYRNQTRTDMLQDLIVRGLQESEKRSREAG